MIGTLAWFRTYGNAAAVVAVPFAATIATTFSSPTSLRAAWMVCCGSKALSSVEYSTLRPLIPPAAFSLLEVGGGALLLRNARRRRQAR